jgi:hypothetical protein
MLTTTGGEVGLDPPKAEAPLEAGMLRVSI